MAGVAADMLLGMGFPKEHIELAMAENPGVSRDVLIDILITMSSGADDTPMLTPHSETETAQPATSPPGPSDIPPGLSDLTMMGFSAADAAGALQTHGGDVSRALNFLLGLQALESTADMHSGADSVMTTSQGAVDSIAPGARAISPVVADAESADVVTLPQGPVFCRVPKSKKEYDSAFARLCSVLRALPCTDALRPLAPDNAAELLSRPYDVEAAKKRIVTAVPDIENIKYRVGNTSVLKFILCTLQEGLPKICPTAAANGCMIASLRAVVEHASPSQMRALAHGFTDCQAAQARIIQSLMIEISGSPVSLEHAVLRHFVDPAKDFAMLRLVSKMVNEKGACDTHTVNAYRVAFHTSPPDITGLAPPRKSGKDTPGNGNGGELSKEWRGVLPLPGVREAIADEYRRRHDLTAAHLKKCLKAFDDLWPSIVQDNVVDNLVFDVNGAIGLLACDCRDGVSAAAAAAAEADPESRNKKRSLLSRLFVREEAKSAVPPPSSPAVFPQRSAAILDESLVIAWVTKYWLPTSSKRAVFPDEEGIPEHALGRPLLTRAAAVGLLLALFDSDLPRGEAASVLPDEDVDG